MWENIVFGLHLEKHIANIYIFVTFIAGFKLAT